MNEERLKEMAREHWPEWNMNEEFPITGKDWGDAFTDFAASFAQHVLSNQWISVETLPIPNVKCEVTDGAKWAIADYDKQAGWGIMGGNYFSPTH